MISESEEDISWFELHLVTLVSSSDMMIHGIH